MACNAGVSAQDSALARGRRPAALGVMHRSFVVPMGEGPRGAASSNDQRKHAAGDGVPPAAAPVRIRAARCSSRLHRRAQPRAAASWLPGVGVVGVKSRKRLTGPLRTSIPAASTPPGAPFHEIGRPAERISRVPGIANGGCVDDPCVPRHHRRCQQRRNNQRRANKSEFHHGLLSLCRVTRLVFATPARFGARTNNAIQSLFQFAAQPAQIAVIATPTQVAAAGISHPCSACALLPK